jgi:hypothetical protein
MSPVLNVISIGIISKVIISNVIINIVTGLFAILQGRLA